jgi:transcription factor MBP1
VQGGYGKYQGTWIPLEEGRHLAERNGVLHKMRPIFDYVPGDRSPPPAPKHATAASNRMKPPRQTAAAAAAARNSKNNVYSLDSIQCMELSLALSAASLSVGADSCVQLL